MVRSALRFVLAQDVSVAVTGLRSVEEAETAAKVGNEYNGLTETEKKRFGAQFDGKQCRDCGLCLPCPQNLDIAALLRFRTLSFTYRLKKWAKKLFDGLEVGVENRTDCGDCEAKCPYELPIISMLLNSSEGHAVLVLGKTRHAVNQKILMALRLF